MFALDRPSNRKDHIICGYCGREVHERGFTSHQRGKQCLAVAEVRDAQRRGLVMADLAAYRALVGAGLVEQLRTRVVDESGKRRLLSVPWTPKWANRVAVAAMRAGLSDEAATELLTRCEENPESIDTELAMVELGA